MRRRDRQKKPARGQAYRVPQPTVLVVTEGKVTEPEYLRGFVKACHNPRVTIEISEGAGVPKTIVQTARAMKDAASEQARRERDDNIEYDEVWCVFDVDDHPDVSGAIDTAHANGIALAVSNPCIELWLWLHFADQPGAQGREQLLQMLKKHVPDYNKHVHYPKYANGYSDAVRRAKAMEELAEGIGDPGMNPTTGVWRLTESIRKNKNPTS